MKWVYFLMHLLRRLVPIIKTQNDIIDLTFDNFYEKHADPKGVTVGLMYVGMKRMSSLT